MDEDMEDSIDEFFVDSEIDPDYEFDAARFFDFSRPESHSEADEAERWFESVGSYPPSPLVIKLDWRKVIHAENASASPESKDGDNMNFSSNISDSDMGSEASFVIGESNKVLTSGLPSHNDKAQDTPKAKTKSVAKLFKPRSSTLMKPTASHLAKLSGTREVSSRQLLGRFQKSLVTIDRSSQNLPGVESDATKRQKLESGYLRKVAHLKHQTLLLHKVPRKVGPIEANSVYRRLKGTVPKEPDLETAHRAQRHGSRNNSKSGELPKSDVYTFKARPLNRKILKAPSLPLHKRRVPQLPEFQVFNLKTSERAVQHLFAKAQYETSSRRLNTEDAFKQEKCEICHKASPLSKKDFKFPLDKRLQNPPIELFTKLSLKSELKSNALSQPKPHMSTKGSKENVPGSFQQNYWRYGINHNQCGSDLKNPEIGPLSNVNRSMDIH
ncbi:protein TPX2-like [Cornus florida]|uniref:protein TPX2-like n=1 Tax=Cornus florida TaxID=4283 RepID=UPI00289C83B5|nr:protein TPX2-like [Cornus florida]